MTVTLAPPPQEHPAIYRAAHQLAHEKSPDTCPRCEKAEMDLLVRGICYCSTCKVAWTSEELEEAAREASVTPVATYDDWRQGYFEDQRRGVKGGGGGGSGKGRSKDQAGGKKFDGSTDEWWLTTEAQQTEAGSTSKRVAAHTKALSFRIDPDRYAQLQSEAKGSGKTFSDWLRERLMNLAQQELNSYLESVDRDFRS
jgi:hypothetical protein